MVFLTPLSKWPSHTSSQSGRLNAKSGLEKRFTEPELHEKAALLLGAFLLRDHSGMFFEIRSPLCQMTAHLAIARFLRNAKPYGINGRMAEATLLTLINAQAPALERLKNLGSEESATIAMTRALRARLTGDFRPLDGVTNRTRMENVAWFNAMANSVGVEVAWEKLTDEQKQSIDLVRAAHAGHFLVEVGHELLRVSMRLEYQELGSVYNLVHQDGLKSGAVAEALNQMPEGCLSPGASGKVRVHVIGWGQWADFLQRHLCHAAERDFYFLAYELALQDDAKAYAAACEKQLGGLRLYPFVRRLTCTDVERYHKSVDDGFKVTVSTPHLVPAQCWNYLCYKPEFAPLYSPNPNPHVNEWHYHNPPPGSVYDLFPRLDHPSLVRRADVVAFLEKLHELAPYDCQLSGFIAEKEYGNQPTTEQAMGLYRAVLPYSVAATRKVAATMQGKPREQEKLLLEAAKLSPLPFYDLGDLAVSQGNDDKAETFYEKACDHDADRVRACACSEWRDRYYIKHHQLDKARQLADEGGEVYSGAGLTAKAVYFELTTNYEAAFEWFSKIEERYGDSFPLIDFCIRYKAETQSDRLMPQVSERLTKLFPKGIEKVDMNRFHQPPRDGVIVQQENELVKQAGLNAGDVIVAINGNRVHNLIQYLYFREQLKTPGLDLIVFKRDAAYHELKANPPGNRFGVTFDDYRN